MRHYMNLNPQPYDMIKKGEKTIELRLNDDKRLLIDIGDTIEFTHAKNHLLKLEVIVKNLYKFSSFEDLYKNLPLEKCGYHALNIAHANPTDMLVYYTKEQQIKYGVLGIEIEYLRDI